MDETESRPELAHAALQAVRTVFHRHPAVTDNTGHPHNSLYTELRATVRPTYVGSSEADGTLTVRWFVSNDSCPPQFTFHYADKVGFEFGWHHHPQEHVDGWGHTQSRTSESEYTYEKFEFDSLEPVRVAWTVCTELEQLLIEKSKDQ